MNWTLILSSDDAGESAPTEEQFIEQVRLMNRDLLVTVCIQVLCALHVDKATRFRTVGSWLETWADKKTLRALDGVRRQTGRDVTCEIAESWQQWLIIRCAIQHGLDTGGLRPDSRDGGAMFFKLCRTASSLSSPPAVPLTGDAESDVLKAAAAVIPRMWLHNPPNLNYAVGRMISFLVDLPERFPEVQRHADSLLERFEADLGVSFAEARDMIAFLGYASIAAKPVDILRNPSSALLDPRTWLSKTTISPVSWDRLRERITAPIETIGDPVPGAGSPWFDPLGLRNRPLIQLPNELILVSMPDLLAEKTNFDMFWWLTQGPGGDLQRNPWQESFGKLCERYVIWLLQEMRDAGGGALRSNVSWGDGQGAGEIDALYWAADRLVVIEISGSFVRNALKMSGDWTQLRRGLDMAFVERRSGETVDREAVAQLDRDIRWLLERRTAREDVDEIPLRRINTIHPVLVAPDRIVRTQGVCKYLDAQLRRRLPDSIPWQVAPLAVLTLEDVEEIHELTVRRDSRLVGNVLPALLHLLRRWQFDEGRYHAFWQFLADGFSSDYSVTHLQQLADRWRGEMANRFSDRA